MQIESVDNRWRTLDSHRASRMTFDPNLKILDKTKDIIVIMGSGECFTLSDALSGIMMDLATNYQTVLSFDPIYFFRIPTKCLVNQEKLNSYKCRFGDFPRISVCPGGLRPDNAIEISERSDKPFDIMTVCPEGGLDSVKNNLLQLTHLISKGIIGKISIFDPLKYDYEYLYKSSGVNVNQKSIKTSVATPESFLFFGHEEIWLTTVSAY